MVSERLVEYLGKALSNVLVHAGNRVQAVPDLPLLFFEKELERLDPESIDDPLECLGGRKLLSLLDFSNIAGRESAALGELLLSHTEPFPVSPKVVTKECTYGRHG
jgi:hypothetical protein